jgi:hypothetical protein
MRKHYIQYLLNEEGQAVQNASVTITAELSGSSSSAEYFTAEDGSNTSTDALLTDVNGKFEFWIGDKNESVGYAPGTKFDIAWTGAGINDNTLSGVDILPDKTLFSTTLTTWIPSGNKFYNKINHGLNRRYPMIYCYDTDTDLMVDPRWIITESNNEITIYFDNDGRNIEAVILG